MSSYIAAASEFRDAKIADLESSSPLTVHHSVKRSTDGLSPVMSSREGQDTSDNLV